MFGLMCVVMAIALFSTITAVTINHIPVDAIIATKTQSRVQTGVTTLAEGAARYIKSVTDVNGNANLPPPGTDLSAVIQPAFTFIPPAPQGMAWTVVSSSYSGLPAIAICLQPSGSVEPGIQRGIDAAKKQFSPAATFVGSSCQLMTNGVGAHLTYWVLANHHG